MSHAANALIIIASSIRLTSSATISTCSVGGAAAARLTALSNGTIRAEVWVIFRSAASTGETVQVDITPTNKQAFVAASFTGDKNVSPFIVQAQAATATGTASAVSTTKAVGAKNQRVLQIVAAVGGPTVSSVGTGQTEINQTVAAGGAAGSRASVELNYKDAADTTAQTQTASLSTAATSASIAIGLLPILTATDKSPINDFEMLKTTKRILDILRVADVKTMQTTFKRLVTDILRIADIETITKTGVQLFTVTVTDKLRILDYHAKTITKKLVEQAG